MFGFGDAVRGVGAGARGGREFDGDAGASHAEFVCGGGVSGKENADRDYRYKRAQYQAQGIPEYWIVDPISGKVTILVMNEGLYDESVFEGSDVISSPLLQRYPSDQKLTVAQILQKK